MNLFKKTYLVLWLIFVGVFFVHLQSVQDFTKSLTPNNIYKVSFDLKFNQDNEDLFIETFIPKDEERQHILEESFINNGLGIVISEDDTGRKVNWSGQSHFNLVRYQALIKSEALQYSLNDQLEIPKNYSSDLTPYLLETEAIQVSHPEIKKLWRSINPKVGKKILPTLKAIFDYTYQSIEGAPFKGFTDALTASRLKQASCNGKSRLFVALARQNNIPARLVGGLILNQGRKKTSHQWVEVYIEGYWVPFGPTNGHFASLPENYLTLYRGDQVLFRHTTDINYDYLFDIDKRLVAPTIYQTTAELEENSQFVNLSQLLLAMGLAPLTIGLFLLFPLCTLAITFLRNAVGVKTFGVFMPMLVGAACVFTGFMKGILAFIVILSVSYFAHLVLNRMRLLKIARLSAIITINTLFFIVGLSLIGTETRLEFGMLSLFPVVIISFIAERIHNLSEENNWKGLLLLSSGTLFSIWLCYLILNSFLLEGLFSIYPEFYLLVLGLQIYIGQWTGLRISELFRFNSILKDKNNPVLSMNERNRNLVYARNELVNLRLAADKLATKACLIKHNIPCPDTFLSVKSLAELHLINDFLLDFKPFALKPNQGSQGNGIIIVLEKRGELFVSPSGKTYDVTQIRDHCIEIISGKFSQSGEEDIAYFEPQLRQHELLQTIAPYGLCDIRVIVNNGAAVSAMLRMPTSDSDGKANLHQGAIGVAIDKDTGRTTHAKQKKQTTEIHPDSSQPLLNIEIPCWQRIVEMSEQCHKAIGLGYMGVDICLDAQLGPLVLEVNGRPGIEIQNVQNRGMYAEF